MGVEAPLQMEVPPDAWVCSKCQNDNPAEMTTCYSCQTPRGGQAWADGQVGAPAQSAGAERGPPPGVPSASPGDSAAEIDRLGLPLGTRVRVPDDDGAQRDGSYIEFKKAFGGLGSNTHIVALDGAGTLEVTGWAQEGCSVIPATAAVTPAA